jgi:hypothetical protein
MHCRVTKEEIASEWLHGSYPASTAGVGFPPAIGWSLLARFLGTNATGKLITSGLRVVRSEVRGFPPPCPPASSQKFVSLPCDWGSRSIPARGRISELYDRIAFA